MAAQIGASLKPVLQECNAYWQHSIDIAFRFIAVYWYVENQSVSCVSNGCQKKKKKTTALGNANINVKFFLWSTLLIYSIRRVAASQVTSNPAVLGCPSPSPTKMGKAANNWGIQTCHSSRQFHSRSHKHEQCLLHMKRDKWASRRCCYSRSDRVICRAVQYYNRSLCWHVVLVRAIGPHGQVLESGHIGRPSRLSPTTVP